MNELERIYNKMNFPKIEKNKNNGLALLEKERGTLFNLWIKKQSKVLELGCRNGNITSWYAKDNDILGLDIDSAALRQCPESIKTEQADLNGNWQIGKEFVYDYVVSSEVIEHLYFPEVVMEKVKSVLKNDGYFIGTVPNAFNLKNRFRLFFAKTKNTSLNEPTHINHFSYSSLESLLKKYFREVEILPIVQKKWTWFARIFPGLGSFLLAFKARK